MTREEAWNRIDAIIAKHEIDDEYVTITSLLDYDALRLARKLLEQELCTDAISREEAIEPFLIDATEEWTSADVLKYLKSLLSVMPTWRYPQVPVITPIPVVPVEEEQGDIQYDDKTTLNKEWRSE